MDIGNAVEFLHTEFIERNSLIGDVQRWSLIANLEELPPDHLIPLQVKRTNGRFLNALHSVGLLTDTVGYIVVSARIVIYPVVVDSYQDCTNSRSVKIYAILQPSPET